MTRSRTTEWRHRRAAQRAQQSEGGLPVRTTPKRSRVTIQEREDYREARRRHLEQFPDYDAVWERPTPKTAHAAYELLKDYLDVRLDAIHPDPVVAQQLLVVALDAAVTAGRYGERQTRRPEDADVRLRDVQRRLTRNSFFDAVARQWSDMYREAREHGRAFSVAQMKKDTARRCWRDLLVNDIALPALWEMVTTRENPLFRARPSKRLDGHNVTLRPGRVLKAFERLVRNDPEYGPTRVRNAWWLWIDGELQPSTEIHPPICAEQPFNEVPIGEVSKEVLQIQEDTRLLFDAPTFVDDYRRIRDARKRIKLAMTAWSGHPLTMRLRWQDLDSEQRLMKKRALRMRAFLLEFRSIYEQATRLKRVVTVRSAFYKVLNRRFQNAHFFPMAVSGRSDQPLPDLLQWSEPGLPPVPDFWTMTDDSRSRWFSAPGPDGPLPLISVDVSSSQTQVTAALLGLPQPELKRARTKRAWDARDGLLRDGDATCDSYTGPEDERLLEAVKNLLMRMGYGSMVHNVVREQRWNRETYGPGWTNAKAAAAFLHSLPGFNEAERFLKACRWIGGHADTRKGLELIDPLDRTPFSWNPIRRADDLLRLDEWDLTLVKPGSYPTGLCPSCQSNRSTRRGNRRTCRRASCRATWTVAFTENDPDASGRYPVDLTKLRQMAAPCLVHMLDGLFAACVIRELRRRGVTNLVSVHDSWKIPATPGAEIVLKDALEAAGEPWLRALVSIYQLFEVYLKPSPDPEWWDMLVEARRSWKDREQHHEWPRFLVA